MLKRVKGTQDFLDLTLFNFLIDTAKRHLALYNFYEIATPILEPTDLFKRSLGTETDVVSKEMYTISSESDNDPAFARSMSSDLASYGGQEKEAICLRPEATAPTMRAFLNNAITTIPWKVFSWGPMFRRERPQKGRFRQFHQINIEIIGSSAIAQDAYLIAMLDRIFTDLKLDTYGLLLNFMGCSDDRNRFKLILKDFLENNIATLCQTCLHRKDTNILRIFDCKNPTCKALYETAPIITDYLCTTCNQEWQELQTLLQQLSISYSHAPTLVRGFDYYSKTVFEFMSLDLGAQNSFCGGGRYNTLAKEIGAQTDQPSIGAALGIERILLLLEHKQNLPLPHKPRIHAIIPFDKAQISLSLQIANMLHAHGLCAEIFVEDESLKSKMRHANKIGAQFCILIGSEEQAAGTVTLKNMIQGTETTIAQRDLIKTLLI